MSTEGTHKRPRTYDEWRTAYGSDWTNIDLALRAAFKAGRQSAFADHDDLVRGNKGYDPECRCQHEGMYVDE